MNDFHANCPKLSPPLRAMKAFIWDFLRLFLDLYKKVFQISSIGFQYTIRVMSSVLQFFLVFLSQCYYLIFRFDDLQIEKNNNSMIFI